jgi:hypothetical protein
MAFTPDKNQKPETRKQEKGIQELEAVEGE